MILFQVYIFLQIRWCTGKSVLETSPPFVCKHHIDIFFNIIYSPDTSELNLNIQPTLMQDCARWCPDIVVPAYVKTDMLSLLLPLTVDSSIYLRIQRWTGSMQQLREGPVVLESNSAELITDGQRWQQVHGSQTLANNCWSKKIVTPIWQ